MTAEVAIQSRPYQQTKLSYDTEPIRNFVILFLRLVTIVVRLVNLGGARSIIAESLLIMHRLQSINRSRQNGTNLRTTDRIITGLCALLMRPGQVVLNCKVY